MNSKDNKEIMQKYKSLKEQLAHYYGNKALEMFTKYFWDLWD
jgi:hypothetical protein